MCAQVQSQRVLREADRDLAKDLTVADVAASLASPAPLTIAGGKGMILPRSMTPAASANWRTRSNGLKRRVAELMLDKQMPQDVAKKAVKATQQRPASDYLRDAYSASIINILYSPCSPHESRSILTEPFLESSLRLEFTNLDTVNRRACLADLPNFFLAHLPHPYDPMPLQAGSCQVGGAIAQGLVEIASPDQDQVNNVT